MLSISSKPTLSQVADFKPIMRRDTSVFANFFQVKLASKLGSPSLQKYLIKISPEIPDNADKLLSEIVGKCKK
jgi:hypothetical protein